MAIWMSQKILTHTNSSGNVLNIISILFVIYGNMMKIIKLSFTIVTCGPQKLHVLSLFLFFSMLDHVLFNFLNS